MSHILSLDECVADRASLVGGKALGLGALLRERFQVPQGFAVTTDAYCEALSGREEIRGLLESAGTVREQKEASDRIREIVERSPMSAGISREIAAAYRRLCGPDDRPVAVRSSATAEDTATASFAGQQETYLWITGADAVVHHVIRCWSSLFTPQAISYRAHRNVPLDDLAMGVVVQLMVPAEAAGVMITIDPVTGDRSQIAIEAAYGLGAAVVNGEVTPDRYAVDKVSWEIRSRDIADKLVAYRSQPGAGTVSLTDVPADEQHLPCLTDDEVLTVARLGQRIERALGSPQDVEWAVATSPTGDREVFLLQARPETVWSQKATTCSTSGQSVLERMVGNLSVSLDRPRAPQANLHIC